MALRLSNQQREQLARAEKILAELLASIQRPEIPDVKGCEECSGTCKDECTGCLTCLNTSKVG